MEWWTWFREERSIYEMAQGRTTLYVGDLETSVTESELFDAFMRESYVSSVRVCRDLTTQSSLGHAYAFFDHPYDAEKALQMLNLTSLKGKHIRVMPYVHNQSLQKRGVGNIFIKSTVCFGSILRWKVATDASGESKGFGFVQYNTDESAQRAINILNGMLLNDEEIYVGPFLQRDSPFEKAMFTDIYVKNLSKSLTDEELNTVFRDFGPTRSCVIIRDGDIPQGKSKGYGFVNFENPEDAEKAVEELNGKQFEDKEWFVTKSKKKYQRESELKRGLRKAIDRSQGRNILCVKNLSKRVTDESLSDLFSPYGTVTSSKVMRDSSGVSKGSGFVAFSKLDEASKAMEDINGEANIREQIYVKLAIAVAKATPEQQRRMLGENLYPMVEQLEPDSAEKITGMLLEMDQTQVLHLLESLDALESKVAEAMDFLRTLNQKQKQSGGGSVSGHLKKVTKSASNTKSSLSPKALDKRSTVLLTNRSDALEFNAAEALGFVGTINQQLHQYGDASGPQGNHSVSDQKVTETCKSSLSPSLANSLARLTNNVSTRGRSAMLVSNRFYSLRESENDEDEQIVVNL